MRSGVRLPLLPSDCSYLIAFRPISLVVAVLLFLSRPLRPSASSAYDRFHDEADAKTFYEQHIDDKIVPGDLESVIKRGWFDLGAQLILKSHEQGLDMAAEVRAAVAEVRKQADELIRLLNKQHNDIQVMSPAFQWAQSANHIFLNIKFAYRFNSPGALSVENENVTATDCCFYFSGIGTHSYLKKKYELNLVLHEPIDPSSTEWSFGSVGKLTVTLKKQRPTKWKRLTKSTQKIPNMHVWWEMKEKYAAEVNRLDDDDDDKSTAANASAAKSAANGSSSGSKTPPAQTNNKAATPPSSPPSPILSQQDSGKGDERAAEPPSTPPESERQPQRREYDDEAEEEEEELEEPNGSEDDEPSQLSQDSLPPVNGKAAKDEL